VIRRGFSNKGTAFVEPEKSRLKRHQQEVNTKFLWWQAGGFLSGTPFFASLICLILFTPLAVVFIVFAAIPLIYLILFQKFFLDPNAEIIKNGNLIISNRPLAYLFLLVSMLIGSIVGWVFLSGIIGSIYSF
jgi:hypothetical protein